MQRHILLDLLFQIWRRLSGSLQWWSLWLVSSKFMVSVAGVVADPEGRVLLQRHRHWVADVWALPGGIVQAHERLEEAFAREVFEETGLHINGIELLGVHSGYRLRLEVFFRSKVADTVTPPVLKLQEAEILEARFFAADALPDAMLPFQKAMILGQPTPPELAEVPINRQSEHEKIYRR